MNTRFSGGIVLLAATMIFTSFLNQCAVFQVGRSPQENQRIIPVEEWDGVAVEHEISAQEIKYITLHHGGVEFTRDDNPGEYLRNLQWWSRTEKGWIDIPYHYLIDLDGRIYEGRDIRYAGDTNTEYDPTGHALICVFGNYEVIEPNQKQLESIVWLMTKLCKDYQLSPTVIASHLDYAEQTVCPGKHLYHYIENGYFVAQVKKNLSKSRTKTAE